MIEAIAGIVAGVCVAMAFIDRREPADTSPPEGGYAE